MHCFTISALQELLQLTDYAAGLEKLLANGHVFVDAQIVVSLSTQLRSGVCFSNNRPCCLRQHSKNQIRLNRSGPFFFFFSFFFFSFFQAVADASLDAMLFLQSY